MTRPPFVLVGGGARSGKSRFALARARALGAGGSAGQGLFVATAEASDDEMRARIARHCAERDERWRTLEAPLALAEALEDPRAHDVVLVDCLTLWLSNLLVRGATADEALARVDEVRGALARRRVPVVIVTNEVGMGLVPETPLGRVFRDLSGLAHQRLAAEADELHVAIMGVVLRLRPDPIAVTPVTVDLPV
ncbi:MAG TPA: bifunctional adenosylcobinamide kinase/adenosylcobinamide-phosphate guanylyltransferase [Polyangia bacterium]|nr:bifunctional adenosylcobinamide kinase/adenosylcobinamide-phosphate guanylyltransferase [Polyangia bacterium]